MKTIKALANKAIQFVNRLTAFWSLWGGYHYENKIDVSFAWELAGIFTDHADALSEFEAMK